MEYVDLHTHSTASDGTLSPTQLIKSAKAAGLAGISLTDHDTGNGLKEAAAAAKEVGIRFVPGIEISADYPLPGQMHILGHFIDPDSPALTDMSTQLLAARDARNPKIVARLNELGCRITMQQVEAIARRGVSADKPVVIGRPHIAQALLEAGCVANIRDAFNTYLGTTGAAYFPKERLTPRQALDFIHAAGGLATLAHPIHLKAENHAHLATIINHMVDAGLDGLECWHSDHDEKFAALCVELAKKYALLPTGGSDFHGSPKPDVRLGLGRSNVRVPVEILDALEAKYKQKRHKEFL